MTARRKTILDAVEEARARLERLGPEEAIRAIADGAVLVDIRPVDLRRRYGIVPGAIVIDRNVLEWRVDPDSGAADPRVSGLDGHVIVMCQQGWTSSLAAADLQDLGVWRATDLAGGFEAWKDAGLPVAEEPPATP